MGAAICTTLDPSKNFDDDEIDCIVNIPNFIVPNTLVSSQVLKEERLYQLKEANLKNYVNAEHSSFSLMNMDNPTTLNEDRDTPQWKKDDENKKIQLRSCKCLEMKKRKNKQKKMLKKKRRCKSQQKVNLDDIF